MYLFKGPQTGTNPFAKSTYRAGVSSLWFLNLESVGLVTQTSTNIRPLFLTQSTGLNSYHPLRAFPRQFLISRLKENISDQNHAPRRQKSCRGLGESITDRRVVFLISISEQGSSNQRYWYVVFAPHSPSHFLDL